MAEDDFDALHSELGQDCDYGDMRQDVADLCFSGDSAFSVSDALEYAAESSGLSGGDPDSSSDSGGSGGCGG